MAAAAPPSIRRKYISALKSNVRAGDVRAHLTLRLPRTGGLDKLNSSMEATVRSINVVTRTPSIVYGLRVTVQRNDNMHPFVLRDPFQDDKAPRDLSRRFRDRVALTRTAFPLALRVPIVKYDDQTDLDNPRYTITLPPNSAIYSTYEHFWSLLGIEGASVKATQQIKGRVGAFNVYGFWNIDPRTIHVIGVPMYKEFVFADLLPAFNIVQQPPNEVQMQIELQDRISSTARSVNPLLVDVVTAAREIGKLIINACVRCNFEVARVLTVTSVDKNVVLTMAGIAGSTTTVEIAFDIITARRMQQAVPFVLEVGRAEQRVLEMLVTPSTDIFRDKYPVSVLLHGVGEASSWFDSRGYVSLLCILYDSPSRIDEVNVIFETDFLGVQLEFIDRHYNTIEFPEDATLSLMFRLSPVQ
jgi:hypothetical protein